MTNDEVLEIFKRTGALLEGHFVLASGRHSTTYLNKDAIYSYPDEISCLCRTLALAFIDRKIDVVAGPEKGGIILTQWVAYHMVKLADKKVRAVYAEKEGDIFVFRRGYEKIVANQRVLLVEDVITTGGSIKKVVQAVRALKGELVGIGALCNRGKVEAATLDVCDFRALAFLTFPTWKAIDCPLCQKGVPVNTEVGKGRDFLSTKQK